MKKIISTLILTTLFSTALVSCGSDVSFKEAHDGYETQLTKEVQDGTTPTTPPEAVGFDLVNYQSEVGELAAYVSQNPGDGEKHPMVIWVTGGWSNSLNEPWLYEDWDDDQSGKLISENGILMMYPSFRGGNENPGNHESYYGEVNDIYSAYEYAASLDYVDPSRIYLVGHSTGGTRALLASEYGDSFRAVFALGAVDDIREHNQENFTFDMEDKKEVELRSPINWLGDIVTPTFVIEGSEGNAANLEKMEKASKNENIHFNIVEGADHFSYIAPITQLIADEINADTGETCSIEITDEEIATAYSQEPIITYPKYGTRTFDGLSLKIDVPTYWEELADFDAGFEATFIADNDTTISSDGNFWNDLGVMVAYQELGLGDYVLTDEIIDEVLLAGAEGMGATTTESATIDGMRVCKVEGKSMGYTYKGILYIEDDKIVMVFVMGDQTDQTKELSDVMMDDIFNSIRFK